MDELILRSLQGRAAFNEEERLRRWRQEAPENDRRYRILAELWSLTGVVERLEHEGTRPDLDDLLSQPTEIPLRRSGTLPRGRTWGSGGMEPEEPTRRGRRWLWHVGRGALAASLVAVGLGVGALVRDNPAGPFAGGAIVTGAGEMTTLMLGDGTTIRLGPKSELALRPEGGDVVARLRGRAFFGVEKDRTRRFRVTTDYGEAVVFGTRFEVRSEDDEFRVLVVDGRVQVSASGAAVDLTEGEMSVVARGRPLARSTVQDAYPYLDWMGNSLVFQNTPLSQALREIKRRYDLQVVLDSPELANVTVTAAFTDQPVENVFLVLCGIIGARCSFEDDRLHIRGTPTGGAG